VSVEGVHAASAELRSGVSPRLIAVANAVVFGLVPLVLAVSSVASDWHAGAPGFDFRGTLWDPGIAILHGHSPYPPPHEADLRTGNPAVYPPTLMLVVAPLTLLPWQVGLAVWLGLVAGAVGLALRLLGVRDPRVYGVALVFSPLLSGFAEGNAVLLLPLGLAALWRWRDRPWSAAAATAGLIVTKVFLWPVLVWLVVTRRVRAASYSVLLAAGAVTVSWAAIGFEGAGSYPALLRALDHVYSRHSQSLYALGAAAGLSDTAAKTFGVAAALAILAAGVAVARRADGDGRLFAAAAIAGLALTPIGWSYDYVVLLVPLALVSRVLSRLWLIPIAFWLPVALGGVWQARAPCCRPSGVDAAAWHTLNTVSAPASLGCYAALLGLTALVTVGPMRRVASRASSGRARADA
jgi:hypothetical protein